MHEASAVEVLVVRLTLSSSAPIPLRGARPSRCWRFRQHQRGESAAGRLTAVVTRPRRRFTKRATAERDRSPFYLDNDRFILNPPLSRFQVRHLEIFRGMLYAVRSSVSRSDREQAFQAHRNRWLQLGREIQLSTRQTVANPSAS